jgi:hypothetical protein
VARRSDADERFVCLNRWISVWNAFSASPHGSVTRTMSRVDDTLMSDAPCDSSHFVTLERAWGVLPTTAAISLTVRCFPYLSPWSGSLTSQNVASSCLRAAETRPGRVNASAREPLALVVRTCGATCTRARAPRAALAVPRGERRSWRVLSHIYHAYRAAQMA